MRRVALSAAAAAALVGAAAAGATTYGAVFHAHSGDRVVVDKDLQCSIGAKSISCSGRTSSKVSAQIESNGEIVIVATPVPHSAAPLLVVRRARCNAADSCRLITIHPHQGD